MPKKKPKNPPITKAKAKKILKDGKAHGKKLTKNQVKFFQAAAGGAITKNDGKVKKKKASRRKKK